MNGAPMLDTVLDGGAIENVEAAFLSSEISLRFPPDTLLLPVAEMLPLGADRADGVDWRPRPTRRTSSTRCCD